MEDLGLFRVLGQPNLDFTIDRDQASRYGINVSDLQDIVQTAVGGNALTQVLKGEQRYDLVLRYMSPYRETKEAIQGIRFLSPTGERVALSPGGPRESFRWRLRNLSGGEHAIRGGEIQRKGQGPGQHRGRGDQKGWKSGEATVRLHPGLGR